jgi:hypothetical protein
MGAKTLLTVEHRERLPETCDVSYELDQGELVLHNCIRGRAVWIFVTAMRQIHVHGAAAHPVIPTPEDLLEDAALLPGFSACVEELFAV